MIEIKNLKKSFEDGVEVLKNINITVNDGEIYGLVGESGSGKSTLLRCINGLVSYDSGSLQIDGTEISSLKDLQLREFRKNIGMIFQHFSLIERLNVYDNIAFPMKIWKYPKSEIDKRVKNMLELVSLEDKMNSWPRELSGGQKQRVAIARSLVLNPKFLLSDESTSALDPRIGKQILGLLKNINKEMGIAIILVTHQMEVIRQTCDKMALLEDGQITVNGDVKHVFLEKPPAFQKLLGVESHSYNSDQCIVRIMIDNETEFGSFFAELARETNINFEYISGGIESFKSSEAFIAELKVPDTDIDHIKNYLTHKQIEMEVLNNGV